MTSKQQPTNDWSNSDRTYFPHPIDKYLEEVKQSVFFQDKKTVGSFKSQIEWYRKRSPHKRLFYRASGLLIIMLGVALPIVAAFGKDLEHKDLWVSILAGLIALLTGVNSFFRWDVAWRGHIQAQLTLDRLQKEWEFAIAKARVLPNADEGLKLAIEATEQFQKRTHDTVEAETKGFFTVQKLPRAKADDDDEYETSTSPSRLQVYFSSSAGLLPCSHVEDSEKWLTKNI